MNKPTKAFACETRDPDEKITDGDRVSFQCDFLPMLVRMPHLDPHTVRAHVWLSQDDACELRDFLIEHLEAE